MQMEIVCIQLELNVKNSISLLSVDYKILTKLLASRLTSVLQTIVHENQTCCVPERSIRDSCRVLQDTVDYCEATDREAGLVSLDQEKAFDRVEWSFLDKVMAAMNIGEIFRSYISTVYRDVSSRVIVNGWISRKIHPTRGVRQGCPLSPILYVLVAETLSSTIRSTAITGL